MGIIDLFFKKERKPSSKTTEIDGVQYNYVKNKKSKTIRITIKDKFNVKISLPISCPYKIAEDFVKTKKDWINKHLELKEFNLIDENFKTKTNNLIITTGLLDEPVIKKAGNTIQFIYPVGCDFYSKEIQDKARLALKKALYIEAKDYLPKRLNLMAEKFGFKYNKVALKTHKTRWGSCSFNNNINLNINLMNLDEKYIDYVLIHELCHTVEKNHQENFWKLLESCMPEAQKIRKELKKKTSIV